MDELHPVLLAPGLDRSPERFILGGVIEHLDLVTRVVERKQRRQRRDDHVRWLVVTRHLQAHERVGAVRQCAKLASSDPAHPASPAEGVAELPQVGAAQGRSGDLEQPQQHSAHVARAAEVASERPPDHEREVNREHERRRRPADVSARVPPASRREPHDGGKRQTGGRRLDVAGGNADHREDQRYGRDHGRRPQQRRPK